MTSCSWSRRIGGVVALVVCSAAPVRADMIEVPATRADLSSYLDKTRWVFDRFMENGKWCSFPANGRPQVSFGAALPDDGGAPLLTAVTNVDGRELVVIFTSAGMCRVNLMRERSGGPPLALVLREPRGRGTKFFLIPAAPTPSETTSGTQASDDETAEIIEIAAVREDLTGALAATTWKLTSVNDDGFIRPCNKRAQITFESDKEEITFYEPEDYPFQDKDPDVPGRLLPWVADPRGHLPVGIAWHGNQYTVMLKRHGPKGRITELSLRRETPEAPWRLNFSYVDTGRRNLETLGIICAGILLFVIVPAAASKPERQKPNPRPPN